jgi:ABC-type phosphate transport system substrate-binding protein
MSSKLQLTVLVAALAYAAPALAEEPEIVVVLNARNPTKTLTAAQAKSIYLGNTAFWNGVVPIRVISRTASSPAAVFFDKVVEMSAQRYSSYWTSRQLAGQGVKPGEVESAAPLVEQIKKNPGAVGFALKSELAGIDLTGITIISLKGS